jgi:hypothetical protein
VGPGTGRRLLTGVQGRKEAGAEAGAESRWRNYVSERGLFPPDTRLEESRGGVSRRSRGGLEAVRGSRGRAGGGKRRSAWMPAGRLLVGDTRH